MNPLESTTPSKSSAPPRSLLVGAAGQVGARMLRFLGTSRAIPTSRNPRGPEWLHLDLATLSLPSEAATLLAPHPLNAIFCIAGMTDVEGCEGQADLAHRTNATGPAALAAYARFLGIPFVFFSSEYVFDGRSGPYREQDPPSPISVYGQSKLAGEQRVHEAYPEALVLRTTVVYGPDERQKNYIYSLMASIANNRPMRVPEDQVSTPTYNQDLVRVAVELVSARAQGIFHVCGPELLSRIEFARNVAHHLDLDDRLLQPVPTANLGQRAPRPLSAGLLSDKLIEAFPSLRPRTLAESIADCGPELRSFFLQQQSLAANGS